MRLFGSVDLAKEDSRTGAALVGNFDDQGRLIMVGE